MAETAPPPPEITTVTVPTLTPPSSTATEWRYFLLASLVISAVVLILTVYEKPNVTITIWLVVRSLQYLLQMLLHYNTRLASTRFRFVRRLENFSTWFFDYWFYTGFFWMLYSIKTLARISPRLLGLYIAFLFLEVIIRLMPCFIHQRGASPDNLSVLPKYRFEVSNDGIQPDGSSFRMVPLGTNGPTFSDIRLLQAEDASCCICLGDYEDEEELNSLLCKHPFHAECLFSCLTDCRIRLCHREDGAELVLLPCNHHLHAACLMKWIRVNPTCPLCKYILDPIEQV